MEEVLAKYFSKEASKDEISLVNAWKSESDENAKVFFEAKSIWLDTLFQTPKARQSVLDNILSEGENKQKQISIHGINWIRYGVAAAVILAVSLVFIFNGGVDTNFKSMALSDGSNVLLHENSTLELVTLDESIREVRVRGKAYFDIERDDSRPFIIYTNNAEVKVLGTSFVVDTYGAKTEVSVESGLVELRKPDEDVVVMLEKGEMGLVLDSNTGIIKKDNEDLNYLSWKTKVLTFRESSMQEVTSVLEDTYGVKVQLENPEFKDCKLTARFNKKKATDAVEIITRTFNIDYELVDGVYILKGKGC